ncbi:sporulation peptidase YabG [Clostridium scatologenes]|uniref:Sporulation peptidase YabG n=1 Tax=Clostridium scatologenes TaxID=1548 RepID=A0A0E3JQN4_CLOSL|nr:sporulation peptidase YabG [Clostridium scatologenes]AKA71079.1 sporulation peptidase YabG [Clostridium scatologenes]
MKIDDIVVRKSYGKDITFKIIDVRENDGNIIYTLKGINLRIIADSPEEDLEIVPDNSQTESEEVFSRKVNMSIKNVLSNRHEIDRAYRRIRTADTSNKELTFGRPGRVLHVDGDPEYLDVCLKVYKQLKLDVVGKNIVESEQPKFIVDLVKRVKPDVVVITGHDSVSKDVSDYMNLDNYKNSKYFVKCVSELRNYEASYDDLIIFAGACQSCYEAILDAGANFASSPRRVLIHCLDPVFLCEKVAYANIGKVVSIQEALQNTITGTKGIGGLQTRGKYREGFPKSSYA